MENKKRSSFTGSAEKMNQGTGLMFDTLPKVFASMPMSNLVGAAFFLYGTA